jgi:hypothetical protein
MKKVNYVFLRPVYKSKKYPEGAYEALYTTKEGTNQSKQRALHAHDDKIAFETVDLWAEDIAKEHGGTYEKTTKAELDFLLKNGSARTYKAARVSPTILNNKSQFRAEMKTAFTHVTPKRLKEVINDGLFLLDQLVNDKEKQEEARLSSKQALADSLFRIYQDSGVEMIDTVNDDEVKTLYNKLKNA